MEQLPHIENIYQPSFFGFNVAFFFYIQSAESIPEPPSLKFTL